MRKSVLLILSLASSLGCASLPWAPRPPAITQYGVHADINPPGFYGVHSKTKKRVYRPFNDPAMKGAQCVSASDYNKGERYFDDFETAAEKHCR